MAIVGRTGSGKSTLLDLVLGLLPAQHGRILIDEETLDASRLAAWRSHIGYVPQTAFVLDDTVRRNVAFGLPDAAIDDARVTRALELAQGWGFVSALPRGLNAVVGEHGAALSGGERQRLAIARALYRDPEVLCLDEATSALDPATERELADATSQLEGRTLIIVTHRLQTARRCDRVAVLARGRLVACGPWETVIADCAELRELAAGMHAQRRVRTGADPGLIRDQSPLVRPVPCRSRPARRSPASAHVLHARRRCEDHRAGPHSGAKRSRCARAAQGTRPRGSRSPS